MKGSLSRREALLIMLTGLGAAGLAAARLLRSPRPQSVPGTLQRPSTTPQDTRRISMEPTPSPSSAPTAEETPAGAELLTPEWKEPARYGPRVVHIHSSEATHWDFGDGYYGNSVDQDVVNEMMDRGILALTGAKSVAEAWRSIIPTYRPGETGIAIKANFNNALWCGVCEENCEEWQLKIDALIHPINALVRGLKEAYSEFRESDIWVYDATIGGNPPVSERKIPKRFIRGCRYPGVRFFDRGCNEHAGFEKGGSEAEIAWSNPAHVPRPPAQRITDVLLDARYLINMPILKRHGGAGVSLGFKNHFGSIDHCPPLHAWMCFQWQAPHYTADYNPLVDIYRNPNIVAKTALTVADGLFGDRMKNDAKPTPWGTFGGRAPNSLFLATDPVALDCVLCDFLHAEGYRGGVPERSDDYLRLAAKAGFGEYERGDPWGRGYGVIDYESIGF